MVLPVDQFSKLSYETLFGIEKRFYFFTVQKYLYILKHHKLLSTSLSDLRSVITTGKI